MELREVAVSDLIPYWRNPRRISDEAVEAIMQSIEEYGYQQPIVVDSEMVIVMGHTRHAAIRRMGYQRVNVLVASGLSAKQIKELRTIDNRTSEFTRWDFDKLMDELGTVDQNLMASFFPEIIDPVKAEVVDEDGNIEQLTIEVTAKKEDPEAEFICPECFHGWKMQISKEDVLSGHLYVKKETQA
jgi:site-specific DNA-methyltransferase (adenine-specific)